jgi:hypothetical protein
VNSLLEGRLEGQLLDWIAGNRQVPLVAVDSAEQSAGGDDVVETGGTRYASGWVFGGLLPGCRR